MANHNAHTMPEINRASAMPIRTIIMLLFVMFGVSAAIAKPQDKLFNRPYADLKRVHLGFSVGMHMQDLKFTHTGETIDGEQWFAEVPSYAPGFCVNVLGDLRLHNNFNLRFSPGMYFGSKTVVMREAMNGREERQDIKSTYVVLPLDLKISGARWRNARPYVTGGVMGSFDVGKRRSEFLWLNTPDVYLTTGIGCDFYLPYFKFNPEIKFCFGLTDVLRHNRTDLDDDQQMYKITKSLKKVKSTMIVLTFYFE